MKGCVLSGFRSGVNETYTLLGCYTVQVDNLLPTVRDSLSVLSSRVKRSRTVWTERHTTVAQTGDCSSEYHAKKKIISKEVRIITFPITLIQKLEFRTIRLKKGEGDIISDILRDLLYFMFVMLHIWPPQILKPVTSDKLFLIQLT